MGVINYSQLLEYGVKLQGIDLNVEEIPFNLFLKNTGDVLYLCFIEYETYDCLVVAETNNKGSEEIRIIPKENIEYISVFYDFEKVESYQNDDKMII